MQLSQEKYADLLQAERNLTGILSEMDKAESCGIDCKQYRATLAQQLAMIANLKLNFAPK